MAIGGLRKFAFHFDNNSKSLFGEKNGQNYSDADNEQDRQNAKDVDAFALFVRLVHEHWLLLPRALLLALIILLHI